ncbi:hypothetical protein SAMN05518683_11759 [Salibacterium halotolerans]|uniref:Uncharacterized protein n=1 Tax=Salibacterium halotolerans TaxID=1884432 RepID=A0A1I5VUK2_9BACI|nr:hypothetical protein SAMN05518683_11759 [Salibacterium halotolerans]
MPETKDISSMNIAFDSEEEREEFLRWAHDSSTSNHPGHG